MLLTSALVSEWCPDALQGAASSVAKAPPPPKPSGSQLPPGWSEAADPGTGLPYYFNAATGAAFLCPVLWHLIETGRHPLVSAISRDAALQQMNGQIFPTALHTYALMLTSQVKVMPVRR